jgi:sulfite reductase subunit B
MDYKPINVEILKKEIFNDNTFLFKLKHKLKSKPGEFVMIGLQGIGECPISVCSYNDKYFELLINNVGSVTNKLSELKEKDRVQIRGPIGVGYPMHHLEGKNIMLIAGGTGTAPLRSVIQYIQKNRAKFNNIDIYLGFRNPECLLFKEDIERWKKSFKVHMILDQKGNMSCAQGFVTDLLDKEKPNRKDTYALICGPPVMMSSTIKKLKSFNFKDEDIYVSLERHMKCGLGKCGHCMIKGHYVCVDGPVFRYDEILKDLE